MMHGQKNIKCLKQLTPFSVETKDLWNSTPQYDLIGCTEVALCYFITKMWDTKLKLLTLVTKTINQIDVLDAGKNLTERDVLVLPMDMVAVEEHKVYFQQVIDHFGQVIFH
jgi:hypothetical protein